MTELWLGYRNFYTGIHNTPHHPTHSPYKIKVMFQSPAAAVSN